LKEAGYARGVRESHARFSAAHHLLKDGADLRARIEGTVNGKAGSDEWRWNPGTLK
jgi:hypothetical protein